MRSEAKRWTMFLAGGSLLLALCVAAMAAEGPGPSMSIAQPDTLSIQGDNHVSFRLDASTEKTVRAHFDLASQDGLISVPVFDALLPIRPGSQDTIFSISPAQLAPFTLGEEVILKGTVGAFVTEGEIPLTASAPEGSGWVLNVPVTAVVYSTTDSQITFRTVNPKGKPLQANLKLKFKNLKGKVVASWKYPIVALGGESVQIVTVPVSVCLQAKLKGANSLKTFLMVNGAQKASGQSLLDWDLVVSASSDKTSGPAPLSVAFASLISGGAAPYLYDWNFGDGSAHSSLQNPNHTFATAGVYTIQLTVADSRGGIVTATPIVVAPQ